MINTVQQGVSINKAAGLHFFDRSTLDFFSSRVESWFPTEDGAQFVTSEQFDSSSPRLYSVRYIKDNGMTGTIGEFQEYATLEAARAAIKTPAS